MSYKDYKKAVELIEKNKEGLYKSDVGFKVFKII